MAKIISENQKMKINTEKDKHIGRNVIPLGSNIPI